MLPSNPTIAYITAGAAGMFCGSCMRDNTLAAAIGRLGWDVQLIPTYTPIRTDEENVSLDQVFFGGINVFLQQKSAFFRRLPRWLDRWIDRPWLIHWLASKGMKTDARELGELTVSMLDGENGRQRKEVRRLTDWLKGTVRPDLVNFSNILICGCLPAVKREVACKTVVTLQGDDLFLLDLPEPYKSQALERIRRICRDVDAFVVFSRYYADFMGDLLGIEAARLHVVSLGLKTDDVPVPGERPERPPTLGYFARICPAKGFHRLVDAFLRLKTMHDTQNLELRAAGWLGESDREFFENQRGRIQEAGFARSFGYGGAVDREEKFRFFGEIDVLCVPTVYRDPKGIFALEAMASGVPVVLPAHGAFPELLSHPAGGVLFPPDNTDELVEILHRLLTDPAESRRIGEIGRRRVLQDFSAETMARQTIHVYEQVLEGIPQKQAVPATVR